MHIVSVSSSLTDDVWSRHTFFKVSAIRWECFSKHLWFWTEALIEIQFCHFVSFQKFNVEGPLKVYPAAENANRNDACGILCLAGEPTILILANRDGRIDHCVVLDGENNKDVDEVLLSSKCLLYDSDPHQFFWNLMIFLLIFVIQFCRCFIAVVMFF